MGAADTGVVTGGIEETRQEGDGMGWIGLAFPVPSVRMGTGLLSGSEQTSEHLQLPCVRPQGPTVEPRGR